MQPTESTISEQSVKRLLSRIKTEPVDVCAGWWCKKNASVSFMVFGQKREMPIFEISLGTRGRILYKNNQKFINPPLFDELFETVHKLHQQKVVKLKETVPNSVEERIDFAQTIILNLLAKHNFIQR